MSALSHKGRGSAPPLPRYWAFNRCHFQTANSWTTVIVRSDLSAVAQRAKAEATKQSILRHSGMVRRTRPGISRFRVRCFASPRNDSVLRHEPQHLLQPGDLAAVRRIKIGEPVERRTIEHRLQLAQFTKAPFSVIRTGA